MIGYRASCGHNDACGHPAAGQHATTPHVNGHHATGFGLVELIVALTILSFGLLALTGAAAIAQRSFIGAQAMEDGANAAALVIDSLMREPAPVAGVRQDARAKAQWSVQQDSVATVIDLTITVADGARVRQLAFRAVHHPR